MTNKLRHKTLNDSLIIFVDLEFFLQVKDDIVISCFQAMTDHTIVFFFGKFLDLLRHRCYNGRYVLLFA
jgi:hypothetical protein